MRPLWDNPDTGRVDRTGKRPSEHKEQNPDGPLAEIVSRSSQCLCQQPCAAGEKPGTGGTRNHTTGGNHLLSKHQHRDRGDPQHVHDSTDEEQCHQGPAAADAISAVAGTERKRAGYIGAKSAVALPALPNIRDGKVVALAVSTPKRAPALPNVPTVAEAGYPDAQYLFWGGLAFPAKTPRAIVERLHAETQKALAVPAVQERLATFGVAPMPMPMTADEFGKFYRDDVAAIVKLAKDVNLVPTN